MLRGKRNPQRVLKRTLLREMRGDSQGALHGRDDKVAYNVEMEGPNIWRLSNDRH